jgi:hypothetical protein
MIKKWVGRFNSYKWLIVVDYIYSKVEYILTDEEISYKSRYLAEYGEYADRHEIEPISLNFRLKPKKLGPKSTSYIGSKG